MNNVSGLTLRGVKGVPVEVEVEITGGLFSISVVGLADTAVKEARERVRAARRAAGVNLRGRVSINLAPADVPKEGALLDLRAGARRKAARCLRGRAGRFLCQRK